MNGSFTPQLKTVVSDCRVTVLEIGETAQFQTTAALTDDSFLDMAKATVKFTSSNPAVAQVDSNGKLTAKGSGIATITTSVTYNGKTVTDTYTVKVNADLSLKSLKNAGKSLLKKDRRQFSVLGKMSSKVTAEAKVSGIKVDVEQAAQVPGTAVVTVSEPVTGDSETYLVNFGIKGQSDEFKSAQLGRQWSVIRQNDEKLRIADGCLEITAEGDVNAAADNGANMVLQSANSDFTIETKVKASALPTGAQNAGLIAYQDDSYFVKFIYTGAQMRRGQQPQASAPASGSLQLYVEENGSAKSTGIINLSEAGVQDNTIWLRLEKDGSTYSAFYSVDGNNWFAAGQAEIALKDIQAGLVAFQGAQMRMGMGMRPGGAPGAAAPAAAQPAAPFKASFDWFRIKNR